MKNRTRSTVIIAAVILFLLIVSVFPRVLFHCEDMSLGDDFLDSETGLPYFVEMDSYYHLRMTRDIALYGHPGDTMKDGVPWDSLRYAPVGRNTSDYKPLLAYLTIAANRLISVFTSQSLEQTAYWMSTFLSVLVVIPVFLLTFEMCGLTGAVAASVLSALNLIYLNYTLPGHYDTECLILWVSCFFFYFGVKLVKGWRNQNRKSMILNGIAFAVSFITLYQSWDVYYMFPVIFAGALVLFALLTWKEGREKGLFSFAPLLLAAVIGVVLLILEKNLFTRVMSLAGLVLSKEESGGLFTNVFNSITEMKATPLWPESFFDLFRLNLFSETGFCIINLAGGIIPFLSAFVMCVILIIRIIRKDIRIESCLLIIWYGITLALAFKANRFVMLFAVPAAILAGNLAGTVCGLLDQRMLKFRAVYRGVILALLLGPALWGVYGTYTYYCSIPVEDYYSNKPVEESLLKIREDTPEDTVLVSWWDSGYFLEEKGRRRTLFDGGTQNGQRAFFISRAFFTENEELSANIFRMLSGSGDEGIDLMFSTFGETEETVFLMDELLSGSKTEAREKLLKTGVSEDSADEITALLFPEDLPLTECVITPDMPWYCGWFPVLGRTSMEKAEGSMSFALEAHLTPISLSESGSTVIDTGNGYDVILEKGGSGWYARTSLAEEPSDEQPYRVERVIIADRDGYREYMQDNGLPKEAPDPDAGRAALPWTVIVSDDGQETAFSMVSSYFADSVFGRLVYLGGAGLVRYEAEPEFSNETLVFRING